MNQSAQARTAHIRDVAEGQLFAVLTAADLPLVSVLLRDLADFALWQQEQIEMADVHNEALNDAYQKLRADHNALRADHGHLLRTVDTLVDNLETLGIIVENINAAVTQLALREVERLGNRKPDTQQQPGTGTAEQGATGSGDPDAPHDASPA